MKIILTTLISFLLFTAAFGQNTPTFAKLAVDNGWQVAGLVGAFGAVLATRFVKGTRFHFNAKANWIAAFVGSVGILSIFM